MQKRNLLADKKVLIVDDEPDVLETLEDLLGDCRIVTAQSFAEAEDRLLNEHFDLTILDIMGVSGYELLEIATRQKVIAVMLTARAVSADNIVKSFQGGAAYYIPKEEMVNIESLLEEILDALEKKKNPWDRWFDRMGAYCERTFGAEWKTNEQGYWDKLPFY